MKKFAAIAAFAVLGSACTTGIPSEEGESIEGLADAISSSCNTVSGLMPTKASLAVAMATEMGRWEPLTDLARVTVNGVTMVGLSSAGNTKCGSGCANTKALLNLQDNAVSQVISQNRFNPTSYREDLLSSLQRQTDRINHLKMNYPSQLPQPHKLTKVGGPLNLGIGACGPHYEFKVTKPDGSAYPNPSNLVNNLYFYGYPINPFIAFRSTDTTVLIDPIDGDNSAPTTTSGSCPTFELDRVYSPATSLTGKCCVTVSGQNGALAAVPKAVGYFGCKAGLIPTSYF
jgi:hypothetical protein